MFLIFISFCVLLYGLPDTCFVSKVQDKKSSVFNEITRKI